MECGASDTAGRLLARLLGLRPGSEGGGGFGPWVGLNR